jgi:DNA polymerase-4
MKRGTTSAKIKTIMHIDADAFFASVEQAFNPLLRGKPVIVGGKETQRGVVHTASYEARARGIHTGMPLSRAKQICPDAIFLKGNYQHYHAVSRQMAQIYARYTPVVEFTSLDDAYLDLTSTLHLHPPPEELAKEIQQTVRQETGVSVSIGVGSNKFIARVASGLNKPGGIVIVPPGEEQDFLDPLPVDIIHGIGHVMHKKLLEMGIFTVKDLRSLSAMTLIQLFGTVGENIWNMAHGMDNRPVKPPDLPSQISRETTFEEDTSDISLVKATLHYLADRICQTLWEKNLVAQKVGIKIRYSDFTETRLQGTLGTPTSLLEPIYLLINHLLKKAPLRKIRIRHVGVQVSQLQWENWQLSLFENLEQKKSLTAAVEGIRRRFGFMSILPAENLILQKKYKMDKQGYILHSPALTK